MDYTDKFLPITDVAKHFQTSRRTIERRREKARQAGDDDTLAAFIIVSSDGQSWKSPDAETVRGLQKNNRNPVWHVGREWLEKNFTSKVRKDTDKPSQSDEPDTTTGERHDDPLVNQLLKQLAVKDTQLERRDEQIKDLNITIQKNAETMRAQAETHSSMLQLAARNQESTTRQKGTTHSSVVDTMPTPQPVQQKPKQTPSKSPPKKRSAQRTKKQPERARRFARFLFGK